MDIYICIYVYIYMYICIYICIYIYTLYVIEYKSRGLTANIFSSIHFENRQERGGLTYKTGSYNVDHHPDDSP